MVDAIINYIAQWVAWVAERVIEWLMSIVNYLVEWLSGAFQAIFDWFAQVFEAIFAYVSEIINNIQQYFNAILDSIASALDAVWSKLEEVTTVVIDKITEFVSDAYSEIRTIAEGIVDEIAMWIDDLVAGVQNIVQQSIEAVASTANQVRETLIGWVNDVFMAVEQVYQLTIANINAAFDAFLGAAGSFIASIETRLTELKSAFADAATSVVSGIMEVAEENLVPIRDEVKRLIEGLTPDSDPVLAASFVNTAGSLSEGKASPEEMRRFVSDYWMKFKVSEGFWAHLFFTIIGLIGSVFMIIQISQTSAQAMMQDFSKAYPYQIFQPLEAAQAWRRGLISEAVAVDTIQKHGYTEENAKVILDLSEQELPEGDLLLLYHRGLITEEQLDAALHQKGYNPEMRKNFVKASFVIPPVSDLITMAVREAFSPEVAKRFGQYEDYPDDLTEWAEKQALTKEWSQRYWAAHWALPSPQQGFEMLHREVIGEDDLNLLLRALDVMPFWRERLTEIAYAPFTRVDIRRMHKVGVLDEKEVLKAYKDIGYKEDKAQKLTDFTLLLNAPETADDEAELKNLSRSNVVNFYSDGIITKQRARELLVGLGYTTDAAEMYLEAADLDEQRAERKAEVKLTLSLAEAGVITFEAAEDRLRSVGLETQEINKAMVDLIRKRQAKTKLPSRSEAERMAKAGIITKERYRELLEILGYSEEWQKAYLEMMAIPV